MGNVVRVGIDGERRCQLSVLLGVGIQPGEESVLAGVEFSCVCDEGEVLGEPLVGFGGDGLDGGFDLLLNTLHNNTTDNGSLQHPAAVNPKFRVPPRPAQQQPPAEEGEAAGGVERVAGIFRVAYKLDRGKDGGAEEEGDYFDYFEESRALERIFLGEEDEFEESVGLDFEEYVAEHADKWRILAGASPSTHTFKFKLTETLFYNLMQEKRGQEEVAAFNLKVLRREARLQNTEKIIRTVGYVTLARYDEEGKHWNYLRVKGPLFLVLDKFGQYKLAILNHCSTENNVISLHPEIRF
ncbi:unnamed protein product [Sphagnum balticum]